MTDSIENFRPYVAELTQQSRLGFRAIRQTDSAVRNQILTTLAGLLEKPDIQSKIIEANAIDLKQADDDNMPVAMKDRLRLDVSRITGVANSVREIAAFADPLGEVVHGLTLSNGIEMIQKRVPLGVVFTVYESRPNVTIDVGALCIKSGNAAILRGGKEAFHSNVALYRVFEQAIASCGLPASIVQLVEKTDRLCMQALLERHDQIDLVVPRGGEGLIRYVTENTRIPIVKHDKGVSNLYVDESADITKSIQVALNAKLHRPSVCNSIENLMIHVGFAHTKELLSALHQKGVRLLGCQRSHSLLPDAVTAIADADQEYGTEYLDERLSVKIVDSLEDAVEFIYKYGSGHSEAIMTESIEAAKKFERMVDSAAVFINCSTRFHDGGQMGMGAEVGISTGRLHVRGPMGARDLTTTTYIMTGNGQVRS